MFNIWVYIDIFKCYENIKNIQKKQEVFKYYYEYIYNNIYKQIEI